MSILLCNSFDDAIIAYVVKKWSNEETDIVLGRTMVQKICYFLKAKGIPLAEHKSIYLEFNLIIRSESGCTSMLLC